MPNYVRIIWDLDEDPDGNVQHIARHGVRPQEVDEILRNRAIPREFSRSGRPMARGKTAAGRYLIVLYEEIDDVSVYPHTAFEPRKDRP